MASLNDNQLDKEDPSINEDNGKVDNLCSESDSDSIDKEIQDIFNLGSNQLPIKSNNEEYITNCQCYSLPMFYDYEKYKKLENSDKILIPMHIMNNIKSKFEDLKFPLIFTIEKLDNEGLDLLDDIGMKKTIKCQAYEFLEDIDDIYIPFRLMQNLWMNEGNLITLRYSLHEYEKGNRIVLRPHTSDFLEIEDPKIFLETGLIENYSVLSKEDIIGLSYFDNTLYFDVLETFPSETIIVNNTDLEVDFEKPLDYKEPIIPEKEEKVPLDTITEKHYMEPIENSDKDEKGFVAFSGKGYKLGDK